MPFASGGNLALRRAYLALAMAGGFFALGYGAILISRQGHAIAAIWPATTFALCLVLRNARSSADSAWMLAAMLPAGLLANGLGGSPPALNLGYSLINILAVWLSLLATNRLGWRYPKMGRMTPYVFWVGLMPSAVSGVAAAIVTMLCGAGDPVSNGIDWMLADTLGFLALFPFGMAVSWRKIAKLRLQRRLGEVLMTTGFVIASVVLVFRLGAYPLQFLVLLSIFVATVRFRLMGAGFAVLVTATGALFSPAAFAPFKGVTGLQMMQLFLAVCSITSVRCAIILNARDITNAVLERRRRRAVRASRFKSQLLAHVSHEVRTPLSAVIGFSGMLETGALSAERAPEFASIIVHNGELLQRLHDDLLDLSRAEAGALSIAPVRVKVSETVFACVGGIRLDTALGGKHVVIDPIADELAVEADPVRLAQIINNLIANAYKYGDNYSPIRVSAAATPDGYGRIEIVNAGPASRRKNGTMSSAPSAGPTMSAVRFRGRDWACPSPSSWWKCRAGASISRARRAG
jgi:signal transduction histidine kinase